MEIMEVAVLNLKVIVVMEAEWATMKTMVTKVVQTAMEVNAKKITIVILATAAVMVIPMMIAAMKSISVIVMKTMNILKTVDVVTVNKNVAGKVHQDVARANICLTKLL